MIPAKTITHISENIRPYIDELHEVPLAVVQEATDHLTPLMMDNHTVLEHQETFKPIKTLDIDQIPEFVPYHPPIKHCDTKDSITSVDSDVSVTSFDRRNSQESSNPSGYSSDGLSSDEAAKDSGCDVKNGKSDQENDSDEPIEIPDEDLAEKICAQVEFYFSNDNILKDAFLLKHVRRNKEGFVSLKLISSFKRVRQVVKDWRVVGCAIKMKSTAVEVNDLGTKVRRIDALPQFDETMPSRTVVATDLPLDKVTIEKVSDLFSKCGEIALIRILRPGGSIPADVRQFINKYPELHQRDCALVEFTESQSARNALNLESGMQIYEMVAPKKKTGKKATISKIIESYKYREHSDMERSRGGGVTVGDDFKYNNFRRNSGYFNKHDMTGQLAQQPHHVCQPQQQHQHIQRKFSYPNNNGGDNSATYDNYNRRASTCSVSSNDMSRKFSNCSEGYASCASDMSRRQSVCSDMSRRPSNCSTAEIPFRRTSNCSDFCPCSRRMSQCSETFRRVSQCSDHSRRFSNGSINFDRRMSNSGATDVTRRVSFDGEFERKISNGSVLSGNSFEPYRKITNDFQQHQYGSGRKCSNDSGYDRRMSNSSVISDYAAPPRFAQLASNVVSGANKAESLVRTPIGPDGSKGFSSRARKVGQVVSPV